MIVLEGQSLLDIAIQCCGSAEAAYDIAVLNGLSIADDLTAGRELTIPAAVNSSVVSYYTQKGIKPSTAITATTEDSEGIDFWAIEDDFEIAANAGIDYDEIEYDFIIQM